MNRKKVSIYCIILCIATLCVIPAMVTAAVPKEKMTNTQGVSINSITASDWDLQAVDTITPSYWTNINLPSIAVVRGILAIAYVNTGDETVRYATYNEDLKTWNHEIVNNAWQYDNDFETSLTDWGGYPAMAVVTVHPDCIFCLSPWLGDIWFTYLWPNGWKSELIRQGVGGYPDLKVPLDVPYIAFQDFGNDQLGNSLWLAHRVSGDNWATEVVDDENKNTGYYPHLAFDTDGLPSIVYINRDNQLRYAKKNTLGQWNIQHLGASTSRASPEPSLAFDTNGHAHIVYVDGTTGKITHAYEDANGIFRFEQAGVGVGHCEDLKMILINNQPHIVFRDPKVNNNIDYAYRRPDGTWWTEPVLYNPGATSQYSLCFDQDGLPAIAFAMVDGGTTKIYCAMHKQVVPTITSISPSSANSGTPGVTLTVVGTGFNSISTVKWNGAIRPTTLISPTRLTASIPASDIVNPGTASVTVYNWGNGGGTSNAKRFTITSVIVNPATITVTLPNGGETWDKGTTHTITWDYTGDTGSYVWIYVIRKSTNIRTWIADQGITIGSGGSGSYPWTIPSGMETGSDYRVYVESVDKPFLDSSNSNFTIGESTPAASITVSAPDGDQTWQRGTTQTITWTQTGLANTNVKILLMKGYGFNVAATIADPVSATSGSYPWTVPSTLPTGTDYWVKIVSISYPDVQGDMWSGWITIPAPDATITVTSPKGGENWQVGSNHWITWTSTGLQNKNVQIELMKGIGNNVVTTITSQWPATTGSFPWTVPSGVTPGTDYWVKIRNNSLDVQGETAGWLEISVPIVVSTKIGVYQNGVWYLDNDGSGTWNAGDRANNFGAPGWTSVVGDWNPAVSGTKIGVTDGQQWYLDWNGNGVWDQGTDKAYNFGAFGWIPVVGDWNPAVSGTKIGVTNGQSWYLDWNGNGVWDQGTDKAYNFGAFGWIPVVGDWNPAVSGTKIGVTNGQSWYLDWNGNGVWDQGTDKAYNFGAVSWTPVVSDWNPAVSGTKIGVTNGQQWYLDWNGNGVWDQGTDKAYNFGAPGWTPVIGDWNGDGKVKIGVDKDGVWYLDSNGNGAWDNGIDYAYSFGAPGWTPIVGKWS